MLRLYPDSELALPPIQPIEITSSREAVGCWTVRERRPPVQLRGKTGIRVGKGRAQSSDARVFSTSDTGFDHGTNPQDNGWYWQQERDQLINDGKPIGTEAPPSAENVKRLDAEAQAGGDKHKGQAMKGRAIENWLNHQLGAANVKPKGDAAGGGANRMQGLSQFSIDAASLERLGLDSKSAERVYRAMFVYSQGLHAALQEAVGKSKFPSQALLVLWKAFTTVLEHAGQSEEQGAESLAALVQRGNEEEKARIESEYRGQLLSLQGNNQKIKAEQRELQLEIQRLRDDEMRLRNDIEMYRNDHQVAMSKYEREIKQRVDAEVRFLEKTRWTDALQEDLNKEKKQSMHYSVQLQEANTAREQVQIEVDALRSQVKIQEAQAGAYKQGALEAAQQKTRHEQQVGQYKQTIERHTQKIAELKDALEQEVEQNKKLLEQNSNNQRELRKLETQFEDESHARKELQNERDTLRERLEKMDRETSELTDERRAMQKELNDVSMKHRTDQIELKRYTEQLERTEKSLEKVEDAHRKLVDAHRSLNVETQYIREDCQHFDEQLKKESELRKLLQHEKKGLTGQLQSIQIEKDTAQLALQSATKELQEVTEKMVKLESIVRDTKGSMTKVTLEHQVELKAHTQKVSILERVIADERNERHALVAETQALVEKREEAFDTLRKRNLEIAELKRHRLEKEEEADRYRILLKAQEQRNGEQLVTVDKYHAAVASHDAEMRQMHVLLECEREEAQRKLQELQSAYASTRHTLEQRIEGSKLMFEDVLSKLNFNPATQKIQVLEEESQKLAVELRSAREKIAAEGEKTKTRENEIAKRDNKIKLLAGEVEDLKEQLEATRLKCAAYLLHAERQAIARCDAEHRTERIKQNTEAFDDMKASLEAKIKEGEEEIKQLHVFMDKPKADAECQVFISISEGGAQTDLSYQYLESTDRMNNDPRRMQKQDALSKASHFVDGGHGGSAGSAGAQGGFPHPPGAHGAYHGAGHGPSAGRAGGLHNPLARMAPGGHAPGRGPSKEGPAAARASSKDRRASAKDGGATGPVAPQDGGLYSAAGPGDTARSQQSQQSSIFHGGMGSTTSTVTPHGTQSFFATGMGTTGSGLNSGLHTQTLEFGASGGLDEEQIMRLSGGHGHVRDHGNVRLSQMGVSVNAMRTDVPPPGGQYIPPGQPGHIPKPPKGSPAPSARSSIAKTEFITREEAATRRYSAGKTDQGTQKAK